MRKIITYTAVTLSLLLSGCNQQKELTTQTTPSIIETETTEETIEKSDDITKESTEPEKTIEKTALEVEMPDNMIETLTDESKREVISLSSMTEEYIPLVEVQKYIGIKHNVRPDADNYDNQVRNQVLSQIYDSCIFHVDYQDLSDNYFDTLTDMHLKAAEESGDNFQLYVAKNYGLDINQFQAKIRNDADALASVNYILEEVARLEKMSSSKIALEFIIENAIFDEGFTLEPAFIYEYNSLILE